MAGAALAEAGHAVPVGALRDQLSLLFLGQAVEEGGGGGLHSLEGGQNLTGSDRQTRGAQGAGEVEQIVCKPPRLVWRYGAGVVP